MYRSSQIDSCAFGERGVSPPLLLESSSVFGVPAPDVKVIDTTRSWQRALELIPVRPLVEMFASDDSRGSALVVEVGDLTVDFTRQRIDQTILSALFEAAQECDVQGAVRRMLDGEPINTTEQRAVGHMALRMRSGDVFEVSGTDVVPEVRRSLDRMAGFADAVRRGEQTGFTGQPFSTVVNIGIGGSDLGPRLVHEALWHLHDGRVECRFIANVDPNDFESNVVGIDPARTLFIVSSKTFTTAETLTNARLAAAWVSRHLGDAGVARHVVAVSADERAVRASGIGVDIVFPLWEWVGGRFSVGSSVGLSAMVSVGPEAFRGFLAGMNILDVHIRQTEPSHNVPLTMALIGIWNHAVLGYATRAVIPYAHALRGLPAYLQQLMMESNGKSVRTDGVPVGLPTSPVVWGGEGTNAQHAFMQLLHQGTSVVPVDFLGFARPSKASSPGAALGQRTLFMNMLAQAQALAFGKAASNADEPHRTFAGDRPSTVITAAELTPEVLGQIVALYEHAVFYEGVLLGINSFDQWGVELGKEMASTLVRSGSTGVDETSVEEQAGRRLVRWFEANALSSGS